MRGTLKKQLLGYMLLVTAFCILIMAAFGSFYYAQAYDQQATSYATQMLEQARLGIETSVDAADRIIDYLSASDDVMSFLRLEDFYSPDRIRLETATRMAMRSYVDANSDLVGGIIIINGHDLYASNELYRITRYPLTEESWYIQAVSAKGARLLLPRPIGRNIRSYFSNYSADDIVSVVRAVYDPDGGEALGVICVDMRLKIIEDRIRDLTLGKTGYVFIQGRSGEVVFAPVNDTVYRINREWLVRPAAVHTINSQTHQLLSIQSEKTGWTMVGVFKSGEVLEPVTQLRRYTILFALIALAAATCIALTFSSSFTGPISNLRLLMSKAEQGNLNVRFDAECYRGEISQLGASFNTMMEKIRTLLQMVYTEQKNKRDADIRTLQAQIKPHFLYNTLDTIRWMAEEKGADDIVRMVGALTRLFRISLSRGKEVVPLSEELEHVRSYLYIQKVRYEEKLNYEIICDKAYLNFQVNKLILQPLVENAIYHGIKQKRGAGHIRVSVSSGDDALLFTVEDDGAGMTGERCDMLNKALASSGRSDLDHGYGIFNVNDRIRLSYGERYGLHYSVNAAGGITVEILFPKLNEAGDEGREGG